MNAKCIQLTLTISIRHKKDEQTNFSLLRAFPFGCLILAQNESYTVRASAKEKKIICAEKLFESKYFTHGKVVFGFIDFRLECFQHCFKLPMLRLCDGADDNFTWNIANFPWCHRSPDCEMRLCGPVNSTWAWEEHTRHKHKRQPYYKFDNNDREYDKNTYKRESLWRPSR